MTQDLDPSQIHTCGYGYVLQIMLTQPAYNVVITTGDAWRESKLNYPAGGSRDFMALLVYLQSCTQTNNSQSVAEATNQQYQTQV